MEISVFGQFFDQKSQMQTVEYSLSWFMNYLQVQLTCLSAPLFLKVFQHFCALAPKIHTSSHNTVQTFYLLSTFRSYVEVVKYSVLNNKYFFTICRRKFVLPSRLKSWTKQLKTQVFHFSNLTYWKSFCFYCQVVKI